MSRAVFRIHDGATIPAIPSGNLLNGWIAGTVVNFVYNTEGKYVYVDWAAKFPNKVGAGGFLINGSYILKSSFDFKFANDNEPSGLWTPDETLQYTKGEENLSLEFDNKKQLSVLGKGITSVNFDGGCFKIYTFEKYDEEYLQSNGASGREIDWNAHIGELLGVSSRSLFTTFENSVLDEPYEYRIAGYYQDDIGKQCVLAVRR